MVGREGIEPPQPKAAGLQPAELTTCSTYPLRRRHRTETAVSWWVRSPIDWRWSRRRDSNPEPAVYKTAALPIELRRRDGQGRTAEDPSAPGDDRAASARWVKRGGCQSGAGSAGGEPAFGRRVGRAGGAWPWIARDARLRRQASSVLAGSGAAAAAGFDVTFEALAAVAPVRFEPGETLAFLGLVDVAASGTVVAAFVARVALVVAAVVAAAVVAASPSRAPSAVVSRSSPSRPSRWGLGASSAGGTTSAAASSGATGPDPPLGIALGDGFEQQDRSGDGGVERADRAAHRDADGDVARRRTAGRGPGPRCRRRSRAARAGRPGARSAARRPRPRRSEGRGCGGRSARPARSSTGQQQEVLDGARPRP